MTVNPHLRVLQIVRNLDIGGAQEVVVTLAKELAELGHQPVVCALRDGPLRADLERLGIPVEIAPDKQHSILAFPYFVAEMWRIRKCFATLVDKYSIDVVQTHLLRSMDFIAATLGGRSRRPLLYWTIHNSNFTLRSEHLATQKWLLKPKRASHRFLYRRLASRISGVIAVSDEVEGSIAEGIGPMSHVVVIPNGVDVSRYGPSNDREAVRDRVGVSSDAVTLTMVGTFKRQKGHEFLIDAATEVAASHPKLRILFVGDGERREQMEQRVRDASLDDVILFLGNRRDVPELLGASDCFVLPSLWEGLPMALLEAMASQLPCIATDVSGTKQVVVPGTTGLLVPPGDVQALASAMKTVLSDGEMRDRMGEAGRHRVETDFSARAQAVHHVARFEADLGSR